MKKVIIFCLFSIYSFNLLSGDTNNFPRTKVSPYELETLCFLKEKGFFEAIYNNTDGDISVTVRSQEEVFLLRFRQLRTQELNLMRKELKGLRILSLPGVIKTDQELAIMQRAIDAYSQKWIPQREREERLSSLEFFQGYQGRLDALKNDIKATSNRFS